MTHATTTLIFTAVEIGDRVTNQLGVGDMGNRRRQGGLLALEGSVTRAATQSLHRRVSRAAGQRVRALPSLLCQPKDGLQVDRPALGGLRAHRPFAAPSQQPQRDSQDPGRGDRGCAQGSSSLGAEETAGHALARPSRHRVAVDQHVRSYLQTPWVHRSSPAETAHASLVPSIERCNPFVTHVLTSSVTALRGDSRHDARHENAWAGTPFLARGEVSHGSSVLQKKRITACAWLSRFFRAEFVGSLRQGFVRSSAGGPLRASRPPRGGVPSLRHGDVHVAARLAGILVERGHALQGDLVR